MSEISLSEIHDVPLFQGLTAIELRELAALLQRESCPAGTCLMTEGEPGGKLFVLLEGACQVVKQTPEGGNQELAELVPPTCFGEMSFFHTAAVSASVFTTSPVELIVLPKETFDSWVRSGSQAPQKLAWNTIAILADRLRRMDQWTCQLVQQHRGHVDEWQNFRASVYST